MAVRRDGDQTHRPPRHADGGAGDIQCAFGGAGIRCTVTEIGGGEARRVGIEVRKRLTRVAQRLRREKTDAETLLWSRLRRGQLDGCRFTTQFQIGGKVADFACRSARLVVELDGGQHAEAIEADEERTRIRRTATRSSATGTTT